MKPDSTQKGVPFSCVLRTQEISEALDEAETKFYPAV